MRETTVLLVDETSTSMLNTSESPTTWPSTMPDMLSSLELTLLPK
jgi:hypothetical protein